MAVALSVLSTTFAIISSWLSSSCLLDIVGGVSLGDVPSVPSVPLDSTVSSV